MRVALKVNTEEVDTESLLFDFHAFTLSAFLIQLLNTNPGL